MLLGYDTSGVEASVFEGLGGLAANDIDAIFGCIGCLGLFCLLLEDMDCAFLLETPGVRKTVDEFLFCLALFPSWDGLSKVFL